MIKKAAIILAGGALLAGTHIGAAQNAIGAKTSAPHTTTSGQRYTAALTLDKCRYDLPANVPGAPKAHAVFTLTNLSKDPLKFTQSGQRFELQILDSTGSVVWDYGKGRMIPHFVRLRMLAPGEKADFPCDIPLQKQDGHPLTPGAYKLHGRLAVSLPTETELGFTVGR